MREMLRGYLSDLQVRSENSGVIGVSSGFQVLDYLMGGFEKGKVYVIGGRPCMGKEELMLSIYTKTSCHPLRHPHMALAARGTEAG